MVKTKPVRSLEDYLSKFGCMRASLLNAVDTVGRNCIFVALCGLYVCTYVHTCKEVPRNYRK